MAISDRQTALLDLIKQIASQNAVGNTGLSTDFSLGLPGLDVGFDLGIGTGGGGTGTNPPDTSDPDTDTPQTLRDVLSDLVNEQVQITTPFDLVTGTLLLVKDDYIVMIENSGDQVLIRIDKIELVSEI